MSEPKRRPTPEETAATLGRAADLVPVRVRTAVYSAVLVLGAVLALGWDLLALWAPQETLGRIAAALAFIGGALAAAYRPTR